MLDDSKFGSRDKKGDWKPFKLSSNIPLFDWPFNIIKNLKWLLGIPGYIFPWTFFYGLIAVILWLYFTPPMQTIKNFHYDWNLRMNPPPYYPDQVDVNNNVILKMASYGELGDDS